MLRREKQLRFEQLERKDLLAIVWANEFGTGAEDPQFNIRYGANETVARQMVNRAIVDWNDVILDQNWDNVAADFNALVVSRVGTLETGEV